MDEPDEFPQVTTWEGDCIEVLANFAECSIDAIVTDPPYALSFMGKEWDSFGDGIGFQKWCEQWARECLRVLKPGGYLLAFGGTRTYHREACAIEDAGFEIRDSLHWIYGSGFPKSRDIGKAIDKEAGALRRVVGTKLGQPGYSLAPSNNDHRTYGRGLGNTSNPAMECAITKPATDEAKEWEGWGTALKPAHEPIVVARKPLAVKHTVAANVLEYGTGAINVDGCRIEGDVPHTIQGQSANAGELYGADQRDQREFVPNESGRWPPNIILTHSPDCIVPEDMHNDCAVDCPVAEMDRQSGDTKSVKRSPTDKDSRGIPNDSNMVMRRQDTVERGFADTGGASRFFPCFRYNAKAPKKERPIVEGLPGHPTVKPVALIQWLVKLVTPPNGVVLDPFAGTGTTAEACLKEGLYCILIENDPDSIKRIDARLAKYNSTKEAV
jgi:site-specific DNA-methyltransferase (adenine-specific)